jgi:hypothetical protein
LLERASLLAVLVASAAALPTLARADAVNPAGPTFYAASPLEGELEPEYAKAILKLRAGAFADAAAALDALLPKLSGRSAPRDRRRILELKALAAQYEDDLPKTRALHEQILALVKEQKAPEAEAAPSLFALALVDLKEGKHPQARAGLEHAHALGYNVAACHFFLGYLDYVEGDLSSASRSFRLVTLSPVPAEIHALAALYESRIAAMQGRGLVSLRYAKDAEATATNPRVKEQAEAQVASGQAASGFRFSEDLLLRLDTNSAFLPLGPNPTDSGFLGNDGPTGEGLELNLWAGYVSSPLAPWQWSLASQTSILSHFNHDSLPYDFLDQQLNLVVTHHPLEPVSFGFKLGLGMLWADDNLDPYRLQGNIGAYFRRELRQELVLLTELGFRPSKNFFDTRVQEEFYRSGPAYDLRVSLFSDSSVSWWNPGLSVWMELYDPSGTEFRSRTFGLDLSNLYFASQRWSGAMGADLGVSAYVDRPSKARYDPFVGLNASGAYALSARYSLEAKASWLEDFSNVGAPYRFSRFTLAAGVAAHI